MDYEEIKRYKDYVEEKGSLITLFITASKRCVLLKKMIDSVLAHNDYDYPVFVLDNYSNDGTKEMVESYHDSRLFFVERESVFGSINYVFAFEICASNYLAVLHDDDMVSDEYLHCMTEFIISNPDADAISCDLSYIDYKDKNIKSTTASYKSSKKDDSIDYYLYKENEYFEKIISRSYNGLSIKFPPTIYKYSFFKDIKKYQNDNVGPSGDLYLWLQAERYGAKLYVINKKLYLYREHPNQVSFINAGIMEKQFLEFISRDEYYSKLQQFNDRNVSQYLKSILKALLLNYSKNKEKRVEIRKAFGIDETLFHMGNNTKKLRKYFRISYKMPLMMSKIMNFLNFLYKIKRRIV